jgi:VanZ family protein
VSRAVRPWLPALAWAAVIFALSSRSTVPVDLELGLDKVAHFGAYALLGAFLARGQLSAGLPALAVALIGWAYAASDEWHQSFVPGRSPDLLDWVADAAGVAAGLAFYHWARRRARRISTPPSNVQTDPIR